MKDAYITITGTCYRHGTDMLKAGMKVRLEKEPDNKYDKEAIKVSMPGLGKIGYVGNSIKTVIGDSMSAGRLYDKIGDQASATVLYIMDQGVICRVSEEILTDEEMIQEVIKLADDKKTAPTVMDEDILEF